MPSKLTLGSFAAGSKRFFIKKLVIMRKNQEQITTANNSSWVNRNPIGFKTYKESNEVVYAKPTQLIQDQETENRYLECVMQSFIDFVKEDANGTLIDYNLRELVKKIRAAQTLFSEDRKNLREFLSLKDGLMQ